jgi:SAM-dependent methyltransferase
MARELLEATCSAPPERSDRMRDVVLAHVPRGRAIRILDLGCGTGSLVTRLADALPLATLVGIDVSRANIDAANRQYGGRYSPDRIRFQVADYREYRAEPFDVIVTDGVLHLIPGDTAALVVKLAGDLNPAGVLICDMPFDCAYNRVFAVVRRTLRSIRSSTTDAMILSIGRLLHGHEMDDDGLRERVAYMYIPPQRLLNERLIARFASAGLHRAAEFPMKSTSPSQLKHRATIFSRDDTRG